MNTTLQTQPTSHRPSFDNRYEVYRSIAVNLFSQMTAGSLTITLPDGRVLNVGTPGRDIDATIRVRDSIFFKKCVLYGDIGFGESYTDGDWDTDDITAVISWALLNRDNLPTMSGSKVKWAPVNFLKWANKLGHLLRPNSKNGSRKNISAHYDLSNDFFRTFLDPSMTYSSAYFREPDMSLEQAQYEKYDRLCHALRIGPKDEVLEIGSGWGGFSMHAAKNYGCHVTTITISKEQFELAQQRIRDAGLSDRIDIRLMDYRDVTGQYDKIVSIEMLEAVGHKYLPVYFEKCQALLKPEGALGLQVITSPDSRYDALRSGVDWIQKHIFPGSLLPSIAAINQAINQTGDMHLHDLRDFGLHYARTLRTWRENFNCALTDVFELGFDKPFVRKWNYYLSYCEAAFQMRNISVMQMVYTRPNNRQI